MIAIVAGTGSLPIEACKSKHYLGLNVRGGTTNRENFGILKDLPILKFTIDLMNDRDNNIDPEDDKIFTYHINGGLNFSLDCICKTAISLTGSVPINFALYSFLFVNLTIIPSDPWIT